MAFKVKFSEQAADDLDEIIGYIGDELSNPQAAELFYQTIKEKLGLLREHPHMFPLYHDAKLGAEGYRSAAVGNFLMFYIADDDEAIVNIVRILYGKRDMTSIFAKSFPQSF